FEKRQTSIAKRFVKKVVEPNRQMEYLDNALANQLSSSASSSNNIHKGLFRRSRTMKESELAVFGSLPSKIDTLVFFIVWFDLTYSFSTCANVLAAVSREHLEHNLLDPSKDSRVKRVYKALLKEYKKKKDPEWLHDPLTVTALRYF
ncbi:14369_t:CDS:2, partial [Gigaspora margarita]